MPTYEYACQTCGTHVEVYQRFSDEPLTECGVCGGPLRKVFHPAGILFKGSGFYVNDSRSVRSKGAPDERKAGSKGGPAKPEKSPSANRSAADSGSRSGSDSGSRSGSDSGSRSGSDSGSDSKSTSGRESGGSTKEKSA